ncbi:MAG: hypothetical protein LBC55_03505, partial [Desulfovibrio sp.]|nr:hypothetical protein [Desulfovibrio sp.]
MDLLLLVLILLVLVNYSYAFLMLKDVARHAEEMGRERGKPAIICLISFLQFFLSTFGVSDFAIGAVIYSKLKWVSPKDLPGTLNTACVIPVAIMALIHISSIKVDFALLALPIIAQMTGAYLSPRFVIKLPARAIMVGLTVGICITAAKIIAVKCGFFPAGGDASSLTGGKLAVLTVLSLLYGALNNLGIGSYALTAATVYLLGLEPEAAFPIMMGASAFSVPMGSIQFIKCGRYARKITVFSSLFGGAGVLAAAYLVKRLDISALDWLFAVLLLCGAVSMLTSAGREDAKTFSQPGQEKKTGDFALSRQITAACFFLSMLGTVLLVAVFIKNFNTISYKHAERNIGEYNLRLRNDVVAYLRSHEYILKSAKVGVAHFISQPIVNIDDLRIYMQNTAALDDDISTLYCTSNTVWNRPGGYAVFSRPWDTPADWDNTARPWFIGAKEAHGDISYSSPYSDALTGEVIMDMSMSIHDSEGRDLGVISESITIRSLRAMLKNANWTSDQHISLIDAKGIYVTHPEEDFAESKDFFSDTELEVYRSSILHNDLFLSVGRDITVYSSFIPESKWFLVSIIQTKSIMSAIVRSIFDLFLAPVTVFIFATPVIILILISIIQSESKAKYMAEYATLEKSNFLARMSHEIRTPMNVVIGLSELALREYGKPKILEYITSIRNAGTSLLAIINDILDFSKIESGNVAFNAAPYETAFLLNDTLTLIRFRLAGKSPELITDIAADIPGGMIGDATRVQQILVNLLTNAVKYTNTGFIRFSAAGERLGEDAIRLTFVIEDSGIGIRPEDMPKLFAYFTRLDEKRNSGIEGAGLGLAIALSLCRAMDGDITVTSEYG